MAKTPEALKLPVQPQDRTRMRKYDQIAQVHRQLTESLQRSQMTKQPVSFDPTLVFHCEQAIAFLAEEVLRLGTEMERLSAALEAGD